MSSQSVITGPLPETWTILEDYVFLCGTGETFDRIARRLGLSEPHLEKLLRDARNRGDARASVQARRPL